MNDADQDFAKRWFEEVWNKQRRDAIGEMIAPGAPLHEAGETSYGPEGFYPFFDRMQAALSELVITVEDTITQEGRICLRWSCKMKHTGDGLGMPATGKLLKTTGISIMRVEHGKISEAWQNWDMLGLMQQIQETRRAVTFIAPG